MINKAILIGHVGGDPEIKHLDNGTALAKFSLATSEKYKNKSGEKVEETEWHNIVIWGKLAEIVEKYVKKGDKLFLEGKIKTEKYEKDGETRYATKIIVYSMHMMGSKGEKQEQQQEQPTQQSKEQSTPEEDDLPF